MKTQCFFRILEGVIRFLMRSPYPGQMLDKSVKKLEDMEIWPQLLIVAHNSLSKNILILQIELGLVVMQN